MIDPPLSHNYTLPRMRQIDIDHNGKSWGYAIVSQSYRLDSTEIAVYKDDGSEIGYFRHNDLMSEETAKEIVMAYLNAIKAWEI